MTTIALTGIALIGGSLVVHNLRWAVLGHGLLGLVALLAWWAQ